jgi:hypothetical protein
MVVEKNVRITKRFFDNHYKVISVKLNPYAEIAILSNHYLNFGTKFRQYCLCSS